MMLAAANDQQQQGVPAPPAQAVTYVPPKDEGGLPWGWITLGVLAYLAWGYWSLLKEQERRDARKRWG